MEQHTIHEIQQMSDKPTFIAIFLVLIIILCTSLFENIFKIKN